MESDVPREMGLEEVRDPEIVKQERQLTELFQAVEDGMIVLIGGTAVDILVQNELSRVHADIDVASKREDADSIVEQLKERYPNVGREGNKIIVPLDGTEVHIGLFDREQDGGYSIDFKGKTVVFSDAFFESEPKYLATGRVRTLAPLVFMQTLNINEAMGVPMRQKDEVSRDLIKQIYFPEKEVNSPEFVPLIKQ